MEYFPPAGPRELRFRRPRSSIFQRWERRTGLAGIFKNDSHAFVAIVIVRCAQNPDAGLFHFHEGVDALGRSKFERIHDSPGGDRISIHRDNLKLMSCEGDAAVLRRACVQDPEHYALSVFDLDSLARAERVAVDRKIFVCRVE